MIYLKYREERLILYIKRIIDANVGPIKKLELEFSISNEKPKPIIFVGENGTGKSTLLSNIVDAFYEIAGGAFSNARQPAEREGYQYYKAISPTEIHFGEQYMYSYVELKDTKCDQSKIEYIFKSGNITIDEFKNHVQDVSPNISWDAKENYKTVIIDKNNAENILSRDILCYFGPDRYEKPFWMGSRYFEKENFEHPTVKNRWAGRMENPISVENMTNMTLQWLLDVIVDSRGDIVQDNEVGLKLANVFIGDLIGLGVARSNIETIMSNILGEEIYFGLNFRNSHGSRFNIKRRKDNSTVIPTLDSLSTGQSALFNMFATIVRYSDTNNINNSIHLSDITGIVVIDEIELHLHSMLQKEVLPKLITLFPKVQFIISTHSPLFLLGMEEEFGENGFEIYQMPNAIKISAERFSEFQKAYTYLTKTQKYEDDILLAISLKQEKMLVITEGATDWKHMKAAYNKLSQISEYDEIFNGLDFEFLEYEPANSKTECENKLEMGNKTLCSLCESYAKLKQKRKIVFIADCDNNDTNKKLGNNKDLFKKWGNNVYSFILPIPDSRKETPNICIEHLYSDKVIKTEVPIENQQISRRLYMGNEFDERGISFKLGVTCERKNICGKNSISIIEGSTGERVTTLEDGNKNIALSKMTFANMILDKKSPFEDIDFDNFLDIFKILKQISNDEV